MNIKKISAAAMAAAVLAVAAPMTGVLPNPLGVTASAEEMKLLTAMQEDLFGATEYTGVFDMADGYYILPGSEKGAKVICIDIEACRKNGKLEYKEVECDADLSDMEYVTRSGNYVEFAKDNVTHVFELDKSANKFKEEYSYEGNGYTRNDGYTCVETSSWEDNDGKIKFSIYKPNGNKIEKEVVIPGFNDIDEDEKEKYFSRDSFVHFYGGLFSCGSEKYLGYVCVPDLTTRKTEIIKDGEGELAEEYEHSTWEYEINGVNKDGSLEPLKKVRINDYDIFELAFDCENNYIAWNDENDNCYYIMTVDDGKTYKLDKSNKYNAVVNVVGTNAILYYYGSRAGAGYSVLDLKTGKMLTDDLVIVASDDGEWPEYIKYISSIYTQRGRNISCINHFI